MEEILPILVEGVMVRINEGLKELITPYTMTSDQFARWKKSKGGVFTKDVQRWINGKEYGKYVLMSGVHAYTNEKFEAICRLIEEDEIDNFKDRKLIDGQIVDKKYMQLKNLTNPEEKSGYIEETQKISLLEDDEEMSLKSHHIPLEDEEASSYRSISLFD